MNTAFPLLMIGAAIVSVLSVTDAVPKLNMAPGCHAAVAVNESIDLSEAEDYDHCMRDEDSARNELEQNWASYSPVAREDCVAETTENAHPSYVEVLTCIQIAQDPASATMSLAATNRKDHKPLQNVSPRRWHVSKRSGS